ncbi:unnamed protein product [Lactuca saligna]|uniref:Pyruvate dehydrogenase (acetyl-transferring) n=1 Tax=Lactuca saligna TaxID=75948 RepID=A0AA35ZKA7_LACSI|nr:unnamed protein product [Lactuca saligna]
MPGVHVDGMDVLKVREVAKEAIGRARREEGPTLVECETYRFRGHSLADHDELHDPDLKAIKKKIDEVVEEAVEFVDESPPPSRSQLLENVFADPRGFGIGPDRSYRCEDPKFTEGTAQVCYFTRVVKVADVAAILRTKSPNLFCQLGLRHIFVVPRASHVIGMITRKDLIFEINEFVKLGGDQLTSPFNTTHGNIVMEENAHGDDVNQSNEKDADALEAGNELVGVVSDENLLELLELAMSSNTTETVKRARELIELGVYPMVLMSQMATLIMDIITGRGVVFFSVAR